MTSTLVPPTSLTSFSRLFGREIAGHIIQEIEIPLIQRDYAQGRKTENVNRIRENFINSLCSALLPDAPAIDLDFVFGDVEEKDGENQGKFYPLDGQQRLTTLFLLHCYLAWRTDIPLRDQSWRKFSYATRPGARDFCDFLTRCRPDFSDSLSSWIKDHADYLPTWQNDPSIQSMLVVLDALHDWFVAKQPDLHVAWLKLIDDESPAIRFHLLPMKANGLTDALYIKMNSRGKPLTPFENFKAHFEEVLKKVHPDKASVFAQKVDTEWSDILWPYRGDDYLIDDEFMRYFRFITTICAWKSGIDFKDDVHDDVLAEQVYGADAMNSTGNLLLLFQAWKVWEGKDVKVEFESILTNQSGSENKSLLMFNAFDREGVDLFHACCRHFGTSQWTLAHSLLFYGVLLLFINQIAENDFLKRLRILRNLVEASGDEIRAGERNNMPKLLVEVEQIVVYGQLKQINTFNQAQVKNEEAKADMVKTMPTLEADVHSLEDHDLLRGGITVFDLDPNQFGQLSRAFISVFDKSLYSKNLPWRLVTAALLAKGDYSRHTPRWTRHRMCDFGAPKNDEPWRELFRGKKGEATHPTSAPLMALLNAVVSGKSLDEEIETFLNDVNTLKDWRYYFVKYEAMREGASGRYTISNNGGYQVCMLNSPTMRGYYYDPYLFAAVTQSQNIGLDRIANPNWPCGFRRHETEPRTLMLENSRLEIECVDQGWQMTNIPTDQLLKANFDKVCLTLGIGLDFLYVVPQNNGIDAEDRVERGAMLLNALGIAGL